MRLRRKKAHPYFEIKQVQHCSANREIPKDTPLGPKARKMAFYSIFGTFEITVERDYSILQGLTDPVR